MKTTLSLLIGILLAPMAMAQVEFGERYEEEHDWTNNDYLVISNEKEGVMLVTADYDDGPKKYPLIFKQLNSSLEKVWEDTVEIKRTFYLKGYYYGQQKNYLMLQNNNQDIIKVLRIDSKTREITEFESKEIAELSITEFEVVNNTAVIGGYFEDRPVVFAYDLEQDKVRTLQNVYQNQSKLVEVRVNKDSVTFNVLATVLDENKERTILVNTYDYGGNPVRDYTLEVEPDYELVNGVSSSINDISQVVVGLYGYKTEYTVSGIYVNYVDRTGKQTMNYYNFGLLPRFLNYMGEKRAGKQKTKARNMAKAGKEHRYKTEIITRELIEEGDRLIFAGEYFKLFTQNNQLNANRLRRINSINTINGFNDRPMLLNDMLPGIRDSDFTHAYALVLNQQGEVVWDDYMDIDLDIMGGANELGRFQWLGDKAAYMYYHDMELHLQVLDGTDETEKLTTNLKLMEEGDEIKQEKDDTLGSVRWYGNHFLVYGVHHIKPEDKSESIRKVFFINKVSVSNSPTASKLD